MVIDPRHQRRFRSLQWRTVGLIALALAIVHGVLLFDSYRRDARRADDRLVSQLHQAQQSFGALLDSASLQLERLASFQVPQHTEEGVVLGPPDLYAGIDAMSIYDFDGGRLGGWNLEGVAAEPPVELKEAAFTAIRELPRPVSGVRCAEQCALHAFVPLIAADGREIVAAATRPLNDLILDFRRLTGVEISMLSPAEQDLSAGYWNRTLLAATNAELMRPLLADLARNHTIPALSPSTVIDRNERSFLVTGFPLRDALGTASDILIVIAVDRTETLATIRGDARRTVLVAIVGAVLAVLMLSLVLRDPLVRIRRLAATLPELAQQRYAAVRSAIGRQAKAQKSADEIDLLDLAALELTDELEALHGSLARRVDELARERDFNELLFHNTQIAMVLHDGNGTILRTNRFAEELLGLTLEELAGRPTARALRHGRNESERFESARVALLNGMHRRMETESRIERPDGTEAVVLWHHSVWRGEADFGPAVLSAGLDITDRQRAEQRLRWLARHDAVTMLLNRNGFAENAQRTLESGRKSGNERGLLLIDIDDFSEVNEALGFTASDEVLRNVAALIVDAMPTDSTIGRRGNSQFSVLLPETNREECGSLAEKVGQTIERSSLSTHHVGVRLSASIGVALVGASEASLRRLIRSAEAAVETAQAAGRGCYRFALEESQRGSRLAWRTKIREALEERRFLLYFQPIIELEANTVEHCEALLRLRAEDGQILAPAHFLEVAAETGQLRAIEREVLRMALEAIGRVPADVPLELGVNLSTRTFEDPDFPAHLRARLEDSGVPGDRLTFEIVETEAITDPARAEQTMATIAEMGCRFAFDDFGVGFTSFDYLRRFPVDYVKIDQAFVRRMKDRPEDTGLVRSMSEMIHATGRKVVAEGVEDAATLSTLKTIGVDYAQGYYIGRPGPELPLATPTPDVALAQG